MRHCAALPRTTNAKDFWWHSLSVPNSNDLCGPGVPVRWMPRLLRSNAVNLYYQNIYWSRLCWFHGDLAALIRVTSNIMWENHIQNRHAPNPPSSALYAHSNIHRKRSDKKKRRKEKEHIHSPSLNKWIYEHQFEKCLNIDQARHRRQFPPHNTTGFPPKWQCFGVRFKTDHFIFSIFLSWILERKDVRKKSSVRKSSVSLRTAFSSYLYPQRGLVLWGRKWIKTKVVRFCQRNSCNTFLTRYWILLPKAYRIDAPRNLVSGKYHVGGHLLIRSLVTPSNVFGVFSQRRHWLRKSAWGWTKQINIRTLWICFPSIIIDICFK